MENKIKKILKINITQKNLNKKYEKISSQKQAFKK